jgi:hypothetical protein
MELSQPLTDVGDDLVGDDLSEVRELVDSLDHLNEAVLPEEESTSRAEMPGQESQEHANAVVTESPPIKVGKAKKNTVKLVMNMILVTANVFFDPKYSDKFNNLTVSLFGQIKECARRNNGKFFTFSGMSLCLMDSKLEESLLI